MFHTSQDKKDATADATPASETPAVGPKPNLWGLKIKTKEQGARLLEKLKSITAAPAEGAPEAAVAGEV